MLVMSEARYFLEMVNICVFQLAFAWIAALTSLHAILILTITAAIQVYEVFHCFQL